MSAHPLPDLNAVRRLLIIRLSAIGDVIHCLPISAALKEAYPHLEITWLVEEISEEIVSGNPCLHDVIVIPRGRWNRGRLRSPQVWAEYLQFVRKLRRRRFDVTLDLQGYAKSALMALATGARYRIGWWRMRDGSGIVSRSLPKRKESVHRVDWFLDVARVLGASPAIITFPLAVPAAERERVREMLAAGGVDPDQPYAVLNQAAGDPARRWGTAQFGAVAARLAREQGMPSVLVGVDKDRAPNQEIIAHFQNYYVNSQEQIRSAEKQLTSTQGTAKLVPLPLDLAGKTTLKELAAVIAGCAVQISGDTGSLHIAAALERPIVGLYGSSDPAHAGPWGQMHHILSRRDLCSRSCTIRRCAFVTDSANQNGDEPAITTARCLEAITPDEVMKMALRAMADARVPADSQ